MLCKIAFSAASALGSVVALNLVIKWHFLVLVRKGMVEPFNKQIIGDQSGRVSFEK